MNQKIKLIFSLCLFTSLIAAPNQNLKAHSSLLPLLNSISSTVASELKLPTTSNCTNIEDASKQVAQVLQAAKQQKPVKVVLDIGEVLVHCPRAIYSRETTNKVCQSIPEYDIKRWFASL